MDRKNLAILILSGLIAICVGVTLWALLRGGADAPISPDYPPQGTERNQQPLGDDSVPLTSPEGGGAINVTFGTEATGALLRWGWGGWRYTGILGTVRRFFSPHPIN